MARIAIDCDGVLADFVTAFIDATNRLWPGKLPRDYQSTDWDFTDALTKRELAKVWRVIDSTDNFWLSLNAISDNVMALAQWLTSRADHDVWICTSRAQGVGLTNTKQTELWLHSCGLRGVNNYLGVVTVPQSQHKVDVYRAMEIEWSIDDKPETVIECGLIDTFKHEAWLLNTSQNQAASVHNRVRSVGAFLEKIA